MFGRVQDLKEFSTAAAAVNTQHPPIIHPRDGMIHPSEKLGKAI